MAILRHTQPRSRIVPCGSGIDLSDEVLADIGRIDAMLDQYGNVYNYIRRSVKSIGVLAHPLACLKIYHLLRDNTPLQRGTAETLEAFISAQLESGAIDLKQRIGFAYLGQGFVSINLWGKGNGLFMHNFTVERDYPNLTREPLEQTAIACTWDIRILHFEAMQWHRYLLSPMAGADKRRYLDTVISGQLDEYLARELRGDKEDDSLSPAEGRSSQRVGTASNGWSA